MLPATTDLFLRRRPVQGTELARRVREGAKRRSWKQATQVTEEWFQDARSDPDTAHQILRSYLVQPDPEAYERERDFMIGRGIPASFLLAPELGQFTPPAGVR
jgi:hypothetical protein